MVAFSTASQLSDEMVVVHSLETSSFFSIIVDRYESKILRYIRRLGVRNHEDQQDVLQDIFIKVYKNLNGFDKSLSFSSWIYRIAHNETISWFRKRNIRPEGHLVDDAEELFLFIPDNKDSPETFFDKGIDQVALKEALSKLEDKYKDPIILRFFEQKEYVEISDILKIPVGTVGTLISRGKKRLQELMPNPNIS